MGRRRFGMSGFLLWIACVVCCALSDAQGQTLRPADYDFFDSRGRSIPGGTPPGSLQLGTARQARHSLFQRGKPLTQARGGEAETAARLFLEQLPLAPNIAPTSPFQLALISRSKSRNANLTHLVFEPRVAGVPFFDSDIQVHLDSQNRVWRADAIAAPPVPGVLAAILSPAQAVAEAARQLSPSTTLNLHVDRAETGANRRTVFSDSGLRSPVEVGLVWFPFDDESRPAWRMYLHLSVTKAYWVVVDGDSGEILFSRNLAQSSEPRGLVFRAPDRPHPNAGAQTTEPFTGWPSASETCPDPIYPAAYRSGLLDGLCWVDGTETVGNNAEACRDTDDNNVCDARASDSQGHFDFSFTDSYSSSSNTVPDRPAALANAFYWVNVIHDWLYELGFDEASGNFQSDNFGRGGAGGDPVRVDVEDGGATNNAYFSTAPDGIAARMTLGLFTSTVRDTAFDADVIIHEYVHGLSNRLVGGPSDLTSLFRWHSGAMGEGWSDAYAVSFTNHPVIGEYVTENSTTGIRSVAYNDSTHTFGQFGVLRLRVAPGSRLLRVPQVHRDGEVWATALWDVRAALGQAAFEAVLTTALKLTPSRPSMLDARDAVVQAAELADAGGPNACAVWTAYAARGFGFSAALNPIQSGQPNDTALSVYESFDLPADCGGSAPVIGPTMLFSGFDSSDDGWTADGLWHLTTRRAATGAQSWWFGQEVTGDYETGSPVLGTLTSPAIDLSAVTDAVVEWDQFLAGEGFGVEIPLGGGAYLNADSGRLMISTDAGASWRTISHLAHNSDGPGFDHHIVNLSRYAGQMIQLRFDFDTFDSIANANEGWFIDNVQVSSLTGGTPVLDVSPASLSFSGVAGGPNPASQSLSIANSGGGTLNWTATVAAGAPWLNVSPASGEAPSALSVSGDSVGWAPGTYTGSIEIEAEGATGSPVAVEVTLTVGAPAGAVADWSFEEAGAGSGVTISDSSGGGHHGTTQSYGTVAVAGVSGSARLFNGASDSVDVPASAALTPPSFTFRTWIRLLSYPDNFGIVAAAYGGNYRGWFLKVNSDGKLWFLASQTPSQARWLAAPEPLALERWYGVSVTYNQPAGLVSLYLDGALVSQMYIPGLEPEISLPLTIGGASWYQGYYLHALIDETQIYPAPRSAAEVAADFAAFTAPAPAVDPAATADWSLDTDGQDASGNAHTASLTGTSAVIGVEGNARRFDGAADHATIAASHRLTPTRFTARAWVKLGAYPGSLGVVVSNYGGNYQGWYLAVRSDGRVVASGNRLPSTTRGILSETTLSLNHWHHLTATYDGVLRTMRIYVDGVLEGQRYGVGLTPHVSGQAAMGRASWYNGYYLAGDLDEVKITPRALSPAEVASDFAAFTAVPLPPREASWSFDETGTEAGQVFADDSGNGHHVISEGGGTSPAIGVSGGARSFDGVSDYARLSPDSGLSSSNFTFTAWVKLTAYPGSWGVIYSNYGGDFQGWFGGVNSSGQLILSIAGLPSSSPWLVSTSALDLDHWYHVAFTFLQATGNGAIYLDGVLERQAAFPVFTPQTVAEPTFGRASWYNGAYLPMTLDAARLYGAVLTPQDITNDMADLP